MAASGAPIEAEFLEKGAEIREADVGVRSPGQDLLQESGVPSHG